jgi:hypothetical protein
MLCLLSLKQFADLAQFFCIGDDPGCKTRDTITPVNPHPMIVISSVGRPCDGAIALMVGVAQHTGI